MTPKLVIQIVALVIALLAVDRAHAQYTGTIASVPGTLNGVNLAAGPNLTISVPNAGSGVWSVHLECWIGQAWTNLSAWSLSNSQLSVTAPVPANFLNQGSASIQANNQSGNVPLPITITVGAVATPPATGALVHITVKALYDDGTPVSGSFAINTAGGTNVVNQTLDSTGRFQGNVTLDPTVTYNGAISFTNAAGATTSLGFSEPNLPPASAAMLFIMLSLDEIDITVSKSAGSFKSFSLSPL